MKNLYRSSFFQILYLMPVFAQATIGNIELPDTSFNRITVTAQSFGNWLRQQPLQPVGSPVLDYRGREYKKSTDTTVAFVMNIDIRNRRTEQCMDILVRLYSEFLWQSGRMDEANYPLPGGYMLAWPEWRDGWRPFFKGIDVTMKHTAQSDSSFTNFELYLRTVYAESHTQQFYHAYKVIVRDSVAIGDFIVKRGSKSHAVMIVDLAQDNNGNYMALIGHGDTPACQFYLLSYREDQPWFPVDFSEDILPLPIKRKMRWSDLRRFMKLK